MKKFLLAIFALALALALGGSAAMAASDSIPVWPAESVNKGADEGADEINKSQKQNSAGQVVDYAPPMNAKKRCLDRHGIWRFYKGEWGCWMSAK